MSTSRANETGADFGSAPVHEFPTSDGIRKDAGQYMPSVNGALVETSTAAPEVYDVDNLACRLMDDLAKFGITWGLAHHLATMPECALALLGEGSQARKPDFPPPSIVVVRVVDSLLEISNATRSMPTAEQMAQAGFALAHVWQRPWLQSLSGRKLAARCGVTAEAMNQRIDRARAIYAIPAVKGHAEREHLSDLRRSKHARETAGHCALKVTAIKGGQAA